MEETEESTTASWGYTDEDRQGIVDTMVTVMLQLIQENPWIPIPEMMDRMVEFGPLRNREDILEVFRGRPIFRWTTTRIETVRTAVVNNVIQDLPVSTRPPANERVGFTIPGTDRYIGWWAPQIAGEGNLFPVHMISLEGGRLQRYPHEGEYTEDYIRGEDSDPSMEETSEEDEIIQL